jgi:hypothetical protein
MKLFVLVINAMPRQYPAFLDTGEVPENLYLAELQWRLNK